MYSKSITVWFLASFTAFVWYVIHLERRASLLPKSLPLAGFRKQTFGHFRASFRQISRTLSTLGEGYEKYGAHGRSYGVPNTAFQPQIMLPQQHIKWLTTHSESVLSSEAVRTERNGVDYLPTKLDPKSSLLFIEKIIGQSLSQCLDSVQPNMYDEIRHRVDTAMGLDTDSWREIDLSEAMSSIINGTSSRVLFGLDLCRDENYSRISSLFIICMGMSTLIVGQLPPWFLRPIAGVLLSIPTFIYKRRLVSYIKPLIIERIQSLENDKGDLASSRRSHDFVTQSIESIRKSKISVPDDMGTYLAEQFIILTFVAMATTGAAATNLLLDILSADIHIDIFELLHLEAASIIKSEDDWWSPAAIKSMVKTDSTIRESLRMGPLQSRGLLRKVLPKEGIKLPDGTHLAQGIWIGVPVQALQRNEEIYSNANSFQPLRFELMKRSAEADSVENPSTVQKLDAAQPSDTFLSFGYGRSSCPGRWFAVRLLKLMVAYITLHYHIEPLAQRPKNFAFGDANIPSFTTKIRVRRRKAG